MTTKLNARADGPHAYSNQAQVQQWEATQWLIECVEDDEDAGWSSWVGADFIISTYEPAIGEETGKFTSYNPDGQEERLRRISIEERGREVLAACIAGKDPEELMSQWSMDIQEASASPSP